MPDPHAIKARSRQRWCSCEQKADTVTVILSKYIIYIETDTI